MKKVIRLITGVLILFIMIINVNAVTISTNSTSGTVDTNSKYVTNTSSLTVSGVQSSDTFKAYKILDAFYNSTSNIFTYEFTSTFKTFLASTNSYKTLTVQEYLALTSGDITNGSTTTTSTLDTLVSQYANYVKTNSVSGSDMSVSGTSATAMLEAGSWLVLPVTTTKVYAVMIGNIEFKANNSDGSWAITSPSIVAKVSSASVMKVLKGTSSVEGTYNINEDYNYVITATVPTFPTNATNKTLSIKEVLDNGISFSSVSGVVIKDGETTLSTKADGTVVDGANNIVATITKNGQEVTISFNADYITTNSVIVEYSAKLNNSAELGSIGNKSTTTLTYANNPYGTGTATTDQVVNTVKTYGIRLFKKDSNNNGLQGAIYSVYSDSNLTTEVGAITTGSDGYGTLVGLKSGTYYLKETKAPTGYKIDNDTVTVAIDDSVNYKEVEVTDDELGFLPSTGGIGIYVFIIVGSILIISSLLFLCWYFKKKKINENK